MPGIFAAGRSNSCGSLHSFSRNNLKNGSASLAEVRDLLGISRKYAQALLEHLDVLQITRRTGDVRILR